MLFEAKIFNAKGKLKKTVTPAELSAKYWESFKKTPYNGTAGERTAPMDMSAKKQSSAKPKKKGAK